MRYVIPLPSEKFKGWPKAGSGGSFGYRRSKTHVHQGVDLGCPVGTPVLAMGDGVVERARSQLGPSHGKKTGAGRNIVLLHPGSVWSWYMHLDRLVVQAGQTVRAGQVIGYSGRSMFSDRSAQVPHLHFEVLNQYPPGREPSGGGIQHRVSPQAFLESQGALQVSAKGSGEGVGLLAVIAGIGWWLKTRGGRRD